MSKPKILSQKQVLESELFNVQEIHLKGAKGKEHTHKAVFRNPTVSVFPVTRNHEIYLIEQYRYLLKRTTLEAVAGFIDKGEEPLVAAKRELKEETGITASIWRELGNVELSASIVNAQVHLYLAHDLAFEEQDLQDDEDIKLVKMDLDEAVYKVKTGIINTASSVIGILLIAQMLKEGKLSL